MVCLPFNEDVLEWSNCTIVGDIGTVIRNAGYALLEINFSSPLCEVCNFAASGFRDPYSMNLASHDAVPAFYKKEYKEFLLMYRYCYLTPYQSLG